MGQISKTQFPTQDSPSTGAAAAATEWVDAFREPPVDYRPVPFWSWNERMEPEEIRRQVREIKSAGWGGAFVHSRIGLVTPYLGEAWFAAVDEALAVCAEEGLLVWLYDEDKWPSGYSGGSVPLANPDFRAKALCARPVGAPAPPDCEALGEAAAGLQVYRWQAPLGDPWFNGTAAVDRGSRRAMRRFLEEAYAVYHERYAEHYGSLVRAEFTDEPCMMFRIACPDGAVPHSETAFEAFREEHGYDPLPQLTLLFRDAPGAERFRLHWHRTINRLFEENYSKQLGEWCAAHGIALTGHYMCEHGVYAQQNWGVRIMPNYRHQQIPGIDHLGRQISERITGKQCQSVVNQYGKPRMLSELYGVAGGGLSFEDRKWIALQQICLGVNLLNPHLSLYTMAGCRKRDFPQNLFYQQPWWRLNRVLDDSLSRLCVAMSQGRFMTDTLVLHPQESAMALWQTRTGDFAPRVESLGDGQDWNSPTGPAERAIRGIEDKLLEWIDGLLGHQHPFDLGDETILAEDSSVSDADSDGARLRIGQAHYRRVVVPSMATLRRTTFDRLREFMEAGGLVVRGGDWPTRIDGEASPELQRWGELLEAIEPAIFAGKYGPETRGSIRLLRLASGNRALCWTHQRQLENGDVLSLVVNLDRRESLEGTFGVSGAWASVVRCDEGNGELRPFATEDGSGEGPRFELRLAPCECALLWFSKDEDLTVSTGVARANAETCRLAETLDLKWSARRLDPNALTLDYAAWRTGESSWSAGPVPVIELQEALNREAYEGLLALRYDFEVGALSPGREVRLVLEYPERCRAFVNGVRLKGRRDGTWLDPRWVCFGIGDLVQPGGNTIILEYDAFRYGDPKTVEPPEHRYGTEIEAVYLIGDFHVEGSHAGPAPLQDLFETWQVPPVGTRMLGREGIRIADPKPLEPGEIGQQGLPFYAGRIVFEAELPPHEGADGLVLEIDRLQAPVAEVAVDGQVVGHFVAQPWRVYLGDYLSEGRAHRLSITLYATLRNLLGPHHNVEGEMIRVGPEHFRSGDMAAHAEPLTRLHGWARGDGCPADWCEDYCLINVGDLGAIRILRG